MFLWDAVHRSERSTAAKRKAHLRQDTTSDRRRSPRIAGRERVRPGILNGRTAAADRLRSCPEIMPTGEPLRRAAHRFFEAQRSHVSELTRMETREHVAFRKPAAARLPGLRAKTRRAASVNDSTAWAEQVSKSRLEFVLGAWFEGFCGFALVLALSQMRQRSLKSKVQVPRSKVYSPGGGGSNSVTGKKSPADLQALTATQQNNFTPQPPLACGPITLTVCVTQHISTTSRQHYFHQTAPLYMERRILNRVPESGRASGRERTRAAAGRHHRLRNRIAKS
jgi:hypothetical protein